MSVIAGDPLAELERARSIYRALHDCAILHLYDGVPLVVEEKKARSDPAAITAFTDFSKVVIQVDPDAWMRGLAKATPVFQPAAETIYGVQGAAGPVALDGAFTRHVFLSIFFHEGFHPIISPRSREDERLTSKALYEGVRAAEPGRPVTEAFGKTHSLKNAAWDWAVNLSWLYLVCYATSSHPVTGALQGVVARELARAGEAVGGVPVRALPTATLVYPYLMSAQGGGTDDALDLLGWCYALFSVRHTGARARAVAVFRGRLLRRVQDPDAVVAALLRSGFSFGSVRLREITGRTAWDADVALLVDDPPGAPYGPTQTAVVEALFRVFDHPEARYDAFRELARVLAPFLAASGEKRGSPDPGTSSQGGGDGGARAGGRPDGNGPTPPPSEEDSLVRTLEDLADSLDDASRDELLREVARPGGKGRPVAGPDSLPCALEAARRYYAEKAPPLEVRVPDFEAVGRDLGDRLVWTQVSTRLVSPRELSLLDLPAIDAFTRRTGLPVLVPRENGFFQVNGYDLSRLPLRGYCRAPSGVGLPDEWVLIVDSSGSMLPAGYVGCDHSPYHRLMLVVFGVLKGVRRLVAATNRSLRVGVVNFSTKTRWSGLVSLGRFWASAANPAMRTLLQPQGGGTRLDPAVFGRVRREASGRVVHTVVTDGALNDTPALRGAVEAAARTPGSSLLLVEVGGGAPFGDTLERDLATVRGFRRVVVQSIPEITTHLASVLLDYS